jgi:IS1 family transposase
MKLLRELGPVCASYQDKALVNLPSTRIECDEIWEFVYAKNRNVPDEHRDEWGYGDVWTWVALDPDSKLVASWLVGQRDGPDAMAFLLDLAPRLRSRVQITTDGHRPYIEAIEAAFGKDVDYAMLVKVYGQDPDADRKFSPPVVLSEDVRIIQGDPNPGQISTSYVERQNLSMRMGMRRFTRLTNALPGPHRLSDRVGCG